MTLEDETAIAVVSFVAYKCGSLVDSTYRGPRERFDGHDFTEELHNLSRPI